MKNKFCINCKYFYDNYYGQQDVCTHPNSLMDTDIVTGYKEYKTAYKMRNDDCGIEDPIYYKWGPLSFLIRVVII